MVKKVKRYRKCREKEKLDPYDMIGYNGNDIDGQEVSYDDIIKFTDAAVLLNIDGDEVWIPKSQIIDANDEIIIITYWLAEKQGW